MGRGGMEGEFLGLIGWWSTGEGGGDWLVWCREV